MSSGAFGVLADAVLVLHLVFVVFVLLGGLLVLRWRWLAWIHVPAAVWGVLVEYGGWICPLTPLENTVRDRAGLAPYTGDFIERYVTSLLYPEHLTRIDQVILGTAALALNGLIYWFVIRRNYKSVPNGRGSAITDS